MVLFYGFLVWVFDQNFILRVKEISSELTRSNNCIREIMKVLYNVGDLKENKDTGSKDVENYIPTGYVC